MNLYIENDYRKLLGAVVEERKKLDPQVTYQRLSEAMAVPKSYLSRVLHGKADLSADQAFRASRHLDFTAEETAYFLLLLDYARSSVKERRTLLMRQIRALQAEHLQTEKHLQAPPVEAQGGELAPYYLDPLVQRTHVCLAIPRFRKDLGLLAQALQISLSRLQKVLVSLERMRLIRRHKGDIELLVETLHLPKASPLYRAWHNQLKMASLAREGNDEESDDYSFAVVFSASETTRREIHARFLDFLKGVEAEVSSAAQENSYQMSFDLFAWTRL